MSDRLKPSALKSISWKGIPMNKDERKGLVFLSFEFLGVSAGIWAFLIFFKSFSSKIISKILGTEGALMTLLQQLASGIMWALISLFTVGFVYLVRKTKAGWTLKDFGFRIHGSWGKDTWYGIVIFCLTYIITLPLTIAVLPSKAKLAGASFLTEIYSITSSFYLIILGALLTTFSTFFCAFWEEIEWRGYLQSLFSKALAPSTGFFVACLYFSLGHYFSRPEWGQLDVVLTVTWGIALGLAFYATGSIWVVAVLHTLSNLFWHFPFYFYLKGSIRSAYDFLIVLGAVLLIMCFVGRRELKSFFQKTKELFGDSGWKASLVGIFLGIIALVYAWGQSVLIRKTQKVTSLGILILFSACMILLSFLYKEKRRKTVSADMGAEETKVRQNNFSK